MTNPAGQTKQKRIRTCISCGSQGDKVGLLRVVRTADGHACFDPTGRVPGRGAYVCSQECFAAAMKAKRLNRALKMQVSEEDYAQIAGELERRADRVHG
jgi:predicted RNA-binding protein YlxR (DUF448 family)